jgi:hypothetical protein
MPPQRTDPPHRAAVLAEVWGPIPLDTLPVIAYGVILLLVGAPFGVGAVCRDCIGLSSTGGSLMENACSRTHVHWAWWCGWWCLW